MSARTGLVWDERFMWHYTGAAAAFIPAGGLVEPEAHVESPPAKRRFRNLLEVRGLLEHLVAVPARAATEEELLRFHTRAYLDRILALSEAGFGDAGEFAPVGPGSFEVAALAAGGCIAAVEAVVGGEVDNAYALVRPPGHHAEPERGRGSCIFSNVVLGVLHAREALGVARVAVIDWDVHHGNAAQHAFWRDPAVLTISLHQDSFYPPGSGLVREIGEGEGRGSNLNVPLPPGSGEGAYLAALERVVAPALRAHRAELVVVASGLDAGALDPMGRMLLHSAAYRKMTSVLRGLADELCGGRLVLCHEGGYSSPYAPFCGLAIVEELAGAEPRAEDPFLSTLEGMGGQELQPHQDATIEAAAGNLAVLLSS